MGGGHVPGALFEVVESRHQQQRRRDPGLRREAVPAEEDLGGVPHRVVVALGAAARVAAGAGVLGCGEGFERRLQEGAGFGVEEAGDGVPAALVLPADGEPALRLPLLIGGAQRSVRVHAHAAAARTPVEAGRDRGRGRVPPAPAPPRPVPAARRRPGSVASSPGSVAPAPPTPPRRRPLSEHRQPRRQLFPRRKRPSADQDVGVGEDRPSLRRRTSPGAAAETPGWIGSRAGRGCRGPAPPRPGCGGRRGAGG